MAKDKPVNQPSKREEELLQCIKLLLSISMSGVSVLEVVRYSSTKMAQQEPQNLKLIKKILEISQT